MSHVLYHRAAWREIALDYRTLCLKDWEIRAIYGHRGGLCFVNVMKDSEKWKVKTVKDKRIAQRHGEAEIKRKKGKRVNAKAQSNKGEKKVKANDLTQRHRDTELKREKNITQRREGAKKDNQFKISVVGASACCARTISHTTNSTCITAITLRRQSPGIMALLFALTENCELTTENFLFFDQNLKFRLQ